MRRLALCLGIVLAAAFCAPTMAEEPCSAKSLSYDDVIAAISGAPDCARADNIMNACRFNASGDVGLAQAVEDKCEPTFLAGLSRTQRRRYAAKGASCLSKYAGEEGTMYVSFAATCKAEVAVDYARKYGAR
jgi:hypothetical protein